MGTGTTGAVRHSSRRLQTSLPHRRRGHIPCCLPTPATWATATWLALFATLLLVGCSKGYGDGWDWERMRKQKRADPFGASPIFPDGKVLQTPPAGTVPADAIVDNTALTEGTRAGVVIRELPVSVDSALLARGADRFGIFCTPCHGERGAGGGTVGVNLKPYEPPVLVSPMVAGTPVGALYHIITHGGARMPAFAAQLDVRERWAVVAYLQSLQASSPSVAADSGMTGKAGDNP